MAASLFLYFGTSKHAESSTIPRTTFAGCFNDVFHAFGNREVDLFPKDIEGEHAKLAAFIYDGVNNGVYKAGFAANQSAYERACRALFAALDELEARLSTRRYLF